MQAVVGAKVSPNLIPQHENKIHLTGARAQSYTDITEIHLTNYTEYYTHIIHLSIWGECLALQITNPVRKQQNFDSQESDAHDSTHT